MAGMRELTAEEKAKPYSKYCYRPHAGASPELAPLLKDHRPMDPDEALPIEQTRLPVGTVAKGRRRP